MVHHVISCLTSYCSDDEVLPPPKTAKSALAKHPGCLPAPVTVVVTKFVSEMILKVPLRFSDYYRNKTLITKIQEVETDKQCCSWTPWVIMRPAAPN